jgi:hypothetical protein
VVKAVFKVHHTDTGNFFRNACANQIRHALKDLEELDSPTVYLKTFAEADEFLNALEPPLVFHHIPARVDNGLNWPTSSGIIGVWASNYLAIKVFLKTDADVLYLFEDDARISPNYHDITQIYLKDLPEDWDILATFVPKDCFQWHNDSYEIGKTYICKTYQDWSCAGYVISKNGAKRFVEDAELNGVSDPIDYYIYNVRQLHRQTVWFNTYSLKPNVYKPVWLDDRAAYISSIHVGVTQENY